MITETVFSVLFEKLTSATLERLARQNGIDSEIRKWKMSLLQIRDVLNDASQKEISDQSVKRWLNGLQHLAYDIDDVLDAVETEAIHRELTEDPPETSKLRKIVSTGFSKFSLRTSVTKDKLDEITTKLQDLIDEKNALGLIMKDEIRPNNINRRYQTSIVHEPNIVGRQDEKAELLQKLLVTGDEPSHQNFSIVPIVGMGGVGKTTLARLLYNENQVIEHFELKAWVCVSDDFDSFSISKVIYQSVTGENREFADLNLLQVALRNHLQDKMLLLVLDDVWSESCEDWETLVGPIHACAHGSKIIMTTRKEQLLKKLGYDHLQKLSCLSLDDALSLFAQHALGVNNFDLHPTLRPHGEGIAKKCNGLPLALKALGRLLRTKHDEEDWKEVSESEIWRLKDDGGIVPALRLSYLDLSACLKRLFAYCSSFPKDFMFDRENLVLLWTAEGLLHQTLPTNWTEERLGHEFFEELLSRSFFQHAPNASFFIMHDLMNDLATSVAGEFFLRLNNDTEKDIGKEILEKCRHLSFVREPYVTYKKLEGVSRAKSLRTFLATSVGLVEGLSWFNLSNKILVDLLPELQLLRVLCLSNFNISEVPDSIGEMRHLRYLNLSRTKITHLPENVSNLYNLQVLIVCDCYKLTKLPNNFSKLKNLRHFDIWNTPKLKKLPLGIGSLSKLQTLSNIIVEGENGFKITELKNLKYLCGKISIKGLDKVQSSIHAQEANFSRKRLNKLEVEWSDVFDVSRNVMVEKGVLNELKPLNESLKQLKVVSYGGIELPSWVGDPSFLRLKHVSIHGCKRCLSLPSLGQLPALKELSIKGLHEAKVVGLELLGTSGKFSLLEVLKFENMSGWEVWSANSKDVFPCLKELVIKNCPKLAEVSLEALPSLRVLQVSESDESVLRSLVQIASKVTKLIITRISGLTDDVWRGVIECIGKITELSINSCNEIRHLWESEAEASKVLLKLRNLCVYHCDNLVSLGKKEEEEGDCGSSLHLTSLRKLEISVCKNIECCTVLNSIETLTISGCRSLTKISFPSGGGQKLKLVTFGNIVKVMKPELGGYEGGVGDTSMMLFNNGSSMPMLDFLCIYLPNLKFIVKLNCFLHLTTLMIQDCSSLETFPDHQLLELASLKSLWIRDCPRLDASFPRGLWPPKLCNLGIGRLKKPISQWGHQNFPLSLVELNLYGSEDVIDFSQLSDLVPSSLARLEIYDFTELESVSRGFQHLSSLTRLSFNRCPNLKDLPEVLFPSLLSLSIVFCPYVRKKISRNGGSGSYWPLISHIPYINISP
uniref:putative disease resistance protein At3g14460 n=1 Tax=Erigeron canadensis TaxID=72917 RepID=UPI001CB8BA24|nr:putative disease resistance protein At3g14460 [Erigeron canadensis]XP_043627236.1 putative disease resistance protein At3g14460 [Erigeron canadensis]